MASATGVSVCVPVPVCLWCVHVCGLMRTNVRTSVPAGGLRDWKMGLGSLEMELEEEVSSLIWVLGP